MRNKRGYFLVLSLWSVLVLVATPASGQTFDTICNWDGIVQNWIVSTEGSQVVANPHPEGINVSAHCFDVITSEWEYDYMIYDMAEPANFNLYPRYRLKVYSPSTGGDVTLKFENSDNTSSHEIVMTTLPGQWNDLEYNFAGLDYNNLTRMVIFFDFQGTDDGVHWYFDDILRGMPVPLELESNLPIVVINTDGVPIPDEPKIAGHMGIIDNGAGNVNNLNDPYNDFDGSIGIETRGQSTQMFPKKSYAFETRDNAGENLDVSLMGMPEENDWILYAPYTDKSILRNVVTFEMGHKMGGYCTRTIYCEVVINNDYKGIYVLEEKIKKDEMRVDIATLKPEEISGNDLTGGYMLKVDKLDPDFVYGVDGWLSSPEPSYPNAMDITFQFYYPEAEEIVSQQRNYIREYVANAESALISTGFSDPGNGYLKFFDAPSFIDFMLLCEISKEVDKYRYSTYFYKEKESDGGKLFAGPAWDFNLGYGNVDYWSPGLDYSGWLYTDVHSYDYSIMFWWKRMMEDAYFRNLTKTRWESLRQHSLGDADIHAVIDSILVHTDAAKDRNFVRWPILGQYVWPNYDWQNNTYADEVDYFEDFLFNRLAWMDNNVSGTVLQPWVSIAAEANKIRLNLSEDYFSRAVLGSSDFRLNDAPGNIYITNVEYLGPAECVLTLSADITGFPGISVTVSEKAVNTWEDLISNRLGTAGIGTLQAAQPNIQVYSVAGEIIVHCDQPELLSGDVEIRSITGQLLGTYELGRKSENIFSHQLRPGIYLVVLNALQRPQVHRIAVVK